MMQLRISLAVLASCLAVTAVAEQVQVVAPPERAADAPTPPDRASYLVQVDSAVGKGALRAFAAGAGARVHHEYRILPNVVNLRGVPGESLSALASTPGVLRVEPDTYDIRVRLHDSTPLVEGLQDQVSGAGFDVDGTGVRVCVVDTGIDGDHVMYSDRIDASAGWDFYNDDSNPEDDNGHGSHVAGIAVGGTGLTVDFGCVGSEPFQGIAPGATLIGVKVLNQFGGGFDSDIIAGIDHCADQSASGGRADVMNLSIGTGAFGGTCDGHSWAAAANAAAQAGVVVVAAAGNEANANALGSPACGSDVIAVGATYDEDFPNCEDSTSTFNWGNCVDVTPSIDQIVCFSNASDNLDVVAPGSVIYSASTAAGGTSIAPQSGTSQASPKVAGLAALLLEMDPGLTPADIRQLVRDGAVDLGSGGFDIVYGHGRIDVPATLALVGPEVCGNGSCGPGEDPCNCPDDCGSPAGSEIGCANGVDDDCDGAVDCADADCATEPACACDGDGICETGEDCFNCASDCPMTSGATCGNGTCEIAAGEDCLSCPSDCNGKQNGNPNGRFCCGDGDGQNPVDCTDSRCATGGFQCTDQPVSAACCGDGVCDPGEDSFNCALDCGDPPSCGDGTCDPGEDECSCPADCGAAPSVESDCTDGVDEDCDGVTDCADSDCSGDPACADPCDGDGICEPGEDCQNCSSDCDSRQNGRPQNRYCCGNGIVEGPEGDGRCDGNP